MKQKLNQIIRNQNKNTLNEVEKTLSQLKRVRGECEIIFKFKNPINEVTY